MYNQTHMIKDTVVAIVSIAAGLVYVTTDFNLVTVFFVLWLLRWLVNWYFNRQQKAASIRAFLVSVICYLSVLLAFVLLGSDYAKRKELVTGPSAAVAGAVILGASAAYGTILGRDGIPRNRFAKGK